MKESMVICESAYKAIGYLPDDKLQLEAFRGLMEYGFYGIIPESENPFVNMVYVQAIPSMRSAAERYEKAIEDGRKGGRPTEVSTTEIVKMKECGMTNKQIAEKIGCSERNVEKRLATYRNNTEQTRTNPEVTSGYSGSDDSSDTELTRTNPELTQGFEGSGDGENTEQTRTNLSYTVSYTDTVSDTLSESVSCTETETASSRTTEKFYPEDNGDMGKTEPTPTPQDKQTFISGDGLPGRRIRDLSQSEANEIKAKLKRGIPYMEIEREYGMRSGAITAKFEDGWRAFVCAKASGRI